MKQFFKKADLLLILALCLAGSALFLPRVFAQDHLECVIYERGAEVHRADLGKVAEGYVFKIESPHEMLIYIDNNGARFQSSDCADKVCVNAGTLTRRGDTAACLPGRVLVTLEGSKKNHNEPDILTY